jgi:hypothetical protein
MVQRRIHAIDTKSVDSELLEVWKVTLTCRSVGERVDEIGWLRERRVGIHGGVA